MNRFFTVLLDADLREGSLNVTLTEEGIIVDLYDGAQIINTWAQTAQEFTDTLLPGAFYGEQS